MKVALLHNVNRGQSEQETEFDLPITIEALTKALSKEHQVVPIECTREFTRWIAQLILEKPDIAFNIAEGFKGPAREAAYPALCEQLGIPFTGPEASDLLICHNKAITKKLLMNSSVPMAWGKLLCSKDDLENLKSENVPYPLIVKLNSEGSSLGMDEHCIVKSWDELSTQVQRVLEKYESDILIEQYIEGKDLSTTYVEGLGIYGPVQYSYPNGSIYDYRLKSTDNHLVKVGKPENCPPHKKEEILSLTAHIVRELNLTGYCRADFRMEEGTGNLYFLECNAQVCFHPDGAFVLGATENSDLTYEDVVLHIVRHAAKHRGRINDLGFPHEKQ